MELYKEILINILQRELILSMPNFECDTEKLMELECYKILLQIKEIIGDDTLGDPECFERIERIVALFEENGISAGIRHDFG